MNKKKIGEKKMDKRLKNREYRLRYKAKKKGLYIQKGKWYHYRDTHIRDTYIGYCIGSLETGRLLTGYDQWNENLLSLEEAEEFVTNY